MSRDANSLAIFIPRGFGKSGNGNLSFLGILETKTYSPGSSENFGERIPQVPQVPHGIPTHSIKDLNIMPRFKFDIWVAPVPEA